MKCAWKELLSVLPGWLRQEVDKLEGEQPQEIRLRAGENPQIRIPGKSIWINRKCRAEDLNFCINAASRYSPWAASTMAKGYLTALGGHRIGVCGEAIWKNGNMEGIRDVTSLCIRVARDFPGIAAGIQDSGSCIILGPPGWGKTTLLRDLIRCRSEKEIHTAVVDERGELFPTGFSRGKCTDILTGCGKAQGMLALLRTMGSDCIAVDEITEPEDCAAALNVSGCGVTLMATAHALDLGDFRTRPVYRPLVENRIFRTAVILHRDKSWHLERMA